MIARTPGHNAFGSIFLCVAFNALLHNVIFADSTVIDLDIPTPESNRIPLLDLKHFFSFCVH